MVITWLRNCQAIIRDEGGCWTVWLLESWTNFSWSTWSTPREMMEKLDDQRWAEGLTTCLFQDKKEEYETINQQPLGRLVRIDHKRVWSQGIWLDLKGCQKWSKKHHNFEFVGELSNTGTMQLGKATSLGCWLCWPRCDFGRRLCIHKDMDVFTAAQRKRVTYSDLVDDSQDGRDEERDQDSEGRGGT